MERSGRFGGFTIAAGLAPPTRANPTKGLGAATTSRGKRLHVDAAWGRFRFCALKNAPNINLVGA